MRASLKKRAGKRLEWINNMVKKLQKKHPNADVNTLRKKTRKNYFNKLKYLRILIYNNVLYTFATRRLRGC